MFSKFERNKVFRDPLYGYITVEYKVIIDLINTKEFQRLRRIRQLSGVSMVFHTAEHSRFAHSLGAYYMAKKVIDEAYGIDSNMDEYQKILFLITALLHDLGHGPYSHAFESVLSVSHEEITARIITNESTEVNKVLSKYKNLAEDAASIIRHTKKFPLIESLVSSQIDVDRMDYLERDAYFTGATYGHIDYNRLIRCMKIVDGQVLFRPSSVNSIESYIMSRYHMYWQVYFHPIGKAYELLLESIYKRVKDLSESPISLKTDISSLINVMKDETDLNSYLDLDDSYVNGMIKQLTKEKDEILRTLANDFMNRKLFKYVDIDSLSAKEVKDKYSNAKNNRYYYYDIKFSQTAYLHIDQTLSYDINDIKIILDNKKTVSLEDYSPIIKGLVKTSPKKSMRIFYLEDAYV